MRRQSISDQVVSPIGTEPDHDAQRQRYPGQRVEDAALHSPGLYPVLVDQLRQSLDLPGVIGNPRSASPGSKLGAASAREDAKIGSPRQLKG